MGREVWAMLMADKSWAVLALLGLMMQLPALQQEVRLRAPLTTALRVPVVSGSFTPQSTITLEVSVPEGAPGDLGVGAFAADFEGFWYQSLHPSRLGPGRHKLVFHFDAESGVQAEGHGGHWGPLSADLTRVAGVFFFATKAADIRLQVHRLELQGATVQTGPLILPSDPPPRKKRSRKKKTRDLLTEFPPESATDPLDLPQDDSSSAAHIETLPTGSASTMRIVDLALGSGPVPTGERVSWTYRVDPLPSNPYDLEQYAGEMVFTDEAGKAERIAAFWRQPMALTDRGDVQKARPLVRAGFEVRYRPRNPGRYSVRLESRRGGLLTHSATLPDLLVEGPIFDDYVRIDPQDRRFFSIGTRSATTAFYWPIGINIRSVNDPRGEKRTGTLLTPDRGTESYEAYLRRLSAAGGTAVEIWMSSWNLALEWREGWPGYAGIGRYNQGTAERLDEILDLAYSLGIRVNLVLNNHGQMSTRVDREWHNNPYNIRHGGMITGDSASTWFTDPEAIRWQRAHRRYLIARYADHPGILGWKLLSEQNLTDGKVEDLRTWHQQATADYEAWDVYGHPQTTHWAGNYRNARYEVASVTGVDYLCIDAYHGGKIRSIADLMWDSTNEPERGLGSYGKPILVTEFGGSAMACPMPQLIAEHTTAAWGAMTAGHAGSPMLWWFEWVDQNNYWKSYWSISRFIQGEDLRGDDARSAIFGTTPDLWSRAWLRPGRVLGYIQDLTWSKHGGVARDVSGASVLIGRNVGAGRITVEWWDADKGLVTETQVIEHPGGELRLHPPVFSRHCAFKMFR